jgi:hypothetical protein
MPTGSGASASTASSGSSQNMITPASSIVTTP